jgi:hypothetical protein
MDNPSSWTKFAKANQFRLDRPSPKLKRCMEIANLVENLPPDKRAHFMTILGAPPAIRTAALALLADAVQLFGAKPGEPAA